MQCKAPCPLYPRKRPRKRIFANGEVCFTPNSGDVRCNGSCLLRAKSRHSQRKTVCPLYSRGVFDTADALQPRNILSICQRPYILRASGGIYFLLGFAMHQFQSILHSQDIVHPTCAKCGAPMWLTRIEPDEPGWEKRTFECQACQNEALESRQIAIVPHWLAIRRLWRS